MSSFFTVARCRLAILRGSGRGREQTFTGDLVRIGKASDNDIVLPEETVSRYHLEILRDHKGYLARDLGSTNGTFLDGADIREAYLRAGAVLTVGTVRMRFQPIAERVEVVPSPTGVLGELYGETPVMREVLGLVEQISPLDATVLVEGEPGTGRDAVARAIHAGSRRRDGRFVVADCRSSAGAALESLLFGHEKGAFSTAGALRPGLFEQAAGGTLYLDHVGEIGLDVQPKLLRALEQREVRRLGGGPPVRVDVRVIASADGSLRREVDKGKVDEGLHFRLSPLVVRLPPLRERAADIPGLARRFLAERGGGELDEEALRALREHDWPGNLRELRALLRHLPLLGHAVVDGPRPAAPAATAFDPALSFREQKELFEAEFERRYLGWLIERAGGNISRAAREADMDRKHLHKLLRKRSLI